MQYKIVRAYGDYNHEVVEELETEVQKLCKEGWKPQGGISISATGWGSFCMACQAMIKEEPRKRMDSPLCGLSDHD